MGGSAEKPDPSEGVLWIESAARLGNVEACREMARCLVEGIGRRTDLTEGLAWLIAGGVPESDPARSGLQARLGEREREAARKLARGLVPQTGGPNPTGTVQGVVPAR
jgi:TPR repeat protein